MRVLVWQWGRRGAGPRIAMELAEGLRRVPGTEAVLSLSAGAEILRGPAPPACDLPVPTYQGLVGLIGRLMAMPFALPFLTRKLRALAPDLAICAMPAPLDVLLATALRRTRIPVVVIVHDADLHPGDAFPLQMTLHRRLMRQADALVALTEHVATRLREQGLAGNEGSGKPLLRASLPPFLFGPVPTSPRSHGGKLRLLSFGRLLPYKGLDLFAEALNIVGAFRDEIEVRVVGSGPESAPLQALRSLSNVNVENRWVPEDEVGDLLAWADALVLSHREASQSGVAAAAIAAGRWVVSTRVGGLVEQLGAEPLALFCDPDPASLAGALRTLIEAPPSASLASIADPRTEWRRMAETILRDVERIWRVGRSTRPLVSARGQTARQPISPR